MTMVQLGKVKEADIIGNTHVTGTYLNNGISTQYHTVIAGNYSKICDLLNEKGVKYTVEKETTRGWIGTVLSFGKSRARACIRLSKRRSPSKMSPAWTKPKKSSRKLSSSCANRKNSRSSAAAFPKPSCSPAPSPAKPTSPSSPSPVPTLSKCGGHDEREQLTPRTTPESPLLHLTYCLSSRL